MDPNQRKRVPVDSGLERRVEREASRISSQHRQLDEHLALVHDALQDGDLLAARRAFARFGDALEAHLALEDGFYFPALHGLAPEIEQELARLRVEHDALRTGMTAVFDCIAHAHAHADADAGACRRALDGWIAELADHERREEALLEQARRARRAAC